MTQTNQTVNELVEEAHDMIGEFDDNEVIPGRYITKGIRRLNDLINSYSQNAYLIPFVKKIEFQTVPGQAEYTFSNEPSITPDVVSNRLVSIEYLQLKFDPNQTVVWPLQEITRTNLFDHTILEKEGTIPGAYLLEKSELFSTVRLYPDPASVYFMTLRGKFYLDKFESGQNITNVPLGEQRFLRYALARELLNFFPGGTWTDKTEDEYQKMENERMSGNDIDLTSRPINTVGRKNDRYNGLGLPILAG
jgi:hypothetical protein